MSRQDQVATPSGIGYRERLRNRLASMPAFKQSSAGYIRMIAEDATEVELQPDEVLLDIGEPCHFGHTPMFVVLDGKLLTENELEVCMGFIGPGELVGEGGAIALADEQPVTVRCCSDGPSTVLRIQGSTVELALVAFAEERDKMEEQFYKMETAHENFEKGRAHWIQKVVVPALAETSILAGCPDELLADVAAPLTEKSYRDGKLIARCGERVESMLLVLGGTVEVEAIGGKSIGVFEKGACFGEVCALGLFTCRTVTIRSVGKSRILSITAKALDRAVGLAEPLVQQAFDRLRESRHEQVNRGLPICALPISAQPDDVCVQTIALQAERIDLVPGQLWHPLFDDDPDGPHFCVLVQGKLVLETIVGQRMVTAFTPGALIPEGLAAQFNTQGHAAVHCEIYRIKYSDFRVAVESQPVAGHYSPDWPAWMPDAVAAGEAPREVKQVWYHRFRLLEKQTREKLRARLSSIRGVTEGVMAHPSDNDIIEWSTRRLHAVESGKQMRRERSEQISKLPNMALPYARTFLDSEEGSSFRVDPPMKDRCGLTRVHSAPDWREDSVRGRGSAHSSLRLPSLSVSTA